MSKYFNDVDTSDIEKRLTPPKPTTYTLNKHKFREAIGKVKCEMRLIQSGSGSLTDKAIYQDKPMPVEGALKRLEEIPNRDNLKGFLEVAAQDLGKIVGTGFSKWFIDAFEEDKNE